MKKKATKRRSAASPKKKAAKRRKSSSKNNVPSPSLSSKAEQQRWEAEENLRTIQRAKEIASNPSKMRRVRALAQKQVNALKGITGDN